jgi:hypothetical protein
MVDMGVAVCIGAADGIGCIVAIGAVVAIGDMDGIGAIGGLVGTGCAEAASIPPPAANDPASTRPMNQRFMM